MVNKKSILIVDDDIAHRTMLRILLDWEYQIHEADSGTAAIDKIEDHPVDLIIMDVRMPGISGLEALESIKTLNPKIPVVMMLRRHPMKPEKKGLLTFSPNRLISTS